MTDTAASTATPSATTTADNQQMLGAVAYVLTLITGLIIYFVANKEQKVARWHAVQAIGLGVALIALNIVLQILDFALAFSLGMVMILGLVNMAVWIGVLVLVILLAVRAYQGRPMRLPFLAELADKHA